MYTENVSNIYLNKAKLRFFKNGKPLAFEAKVKEFGEISGELQGKGPFSPDFSIKGVYIENRKGYGEFHIDTINPLHILGITGINNNSEPLKYKLSNTLFSSFWSQKWLGYLFQIIKI